MVDDPRHLLIADEGLELRPLGELEGQSRGRQLLEDEGVAFVDITGISRDDTADAVAMLADDGLHPSTLQYSRWTEAAVPVALRLLAA